MDPHLSDTHANIGACECHDTHRNMRYTQKNSITVYVSAQWCFYPKIHHHTLSLLFLYSFLFFLTKFQNKIRFDNKTTTSHHNEDQTEKEVSDDTDTTMTIHVLLLYGSTLPHTLVCDHHSRLLEAQSKHDEILQIDSNLFSSTIMYVSFHSLQIRFINRIRTPFHKTSSSSDLLYHIPER